MIVRPSEERDAGRLAEIYAHHVLNGTGTFEEVPPTAAEMLARRADVLGHRLPHLVAEEAGVVLGYAYAGPFRTRIAYRYTVEDSVYVAPGALGQGVGKALLAKVLQECEALDLRQVVAMIGDSANAASVALHESLGFQHCGLGRAVGFKHGRWLDVVWMQKALNGGDATVPAGSGLQLKR